MQVCEQHNAHQPWKCHSIVYSAVNLRAKALGECSSTVARGPAIDLCLLFERQRYVSIAGNRQEHPRVTGLELFMEQKTDEMGGRWTARMCCKNGHAHTARRVSGAGECTDLT